jgi:glycosyltransferase involved in cell wall biosynthesis
MKFLIVAPRFHTNLYYRAKSLQDEGHVVKVVVLYKGKSEYYRDIDLIQIDLSFFSFHTLKCFSIFKNNNLKASLELRLQSPSKKLKQIIKSFLPDVIILKAYQNLLALKTLIIAKKYKVKVLMLTQTNFTHIKGSVFLFRISIMLFKFLKVHAYITPIKSNYEAFHNFGINNVFYLPFVYPAGNIIPKLINNEEIKIISIGKFQKRKDQMLLLKVFKKLFEEHYPVNLCIIGEIADQNYFDTISNYIKKNKLSINICLKTNIKYTEMKKEYQNYDIFVLPAYLEPAAYSPVEALSNGLPVICSDQNGTKCYIEEGENGYIFKAQNKNDLYEKIKLCIANRIKLLKMQQNALLSAKENHKPEIFAQKIIQIQE